MTFQEVVLMVVFGLSLLVGSVSAEADTLFLAHYNKSLNADYSAVVDGKAEVISGARLTEGSKGYPFKDSQPAPEAADIGYSEKVPAGIHHSFSPKIDLRQGTIELFVKPNWDLYEPQKNTGGHEHTFLYIPLQAGGAARIELYVGSKNWGDFPRLVFLIHDGKTSIIAHTKIEKLEWKKDTWHYLVATWTSTKINLFYDGKLVAETEGTESNEPLVDMRATGVIEIGNSSLWENSVPIYALIDEVRISSDVLYADKDEIPLPTLEFTTGASPKKMEERAGEGSGKSITAYYINETPSINGKLDDLLWKKLPVACGFTDISPKHQFVPYQTYFSAAYDKKNLYFGIFCEESLLEHIKATAKDRDGNVFSDDSVEVYIDADRTGERYVQLALNPLGTQYDGLKVDSSWNGDWTSAVKIGKNGWAMEIAMPFSTLGMVFPKPGETYRINITRNRNTEKMDPYSSWSVLTSGFHSPKDFGALVFAAPDITPNKEEEIRWNRDFLETVNTEVNTAIRKGEQGLRRASKIPKEDRTEIVEQKSNLIGMMIETLKKRAKVGLSLEEGSSVFRQAKELTKESDIMANELFGIGIGLVNPPEDLKIGINREGRFWFLSSKEAIFAIDAESGVVVGIWDGNKSCYIRNSYDLYTIETITQVKRTDERMDEVLEIKRTDELLTFVCKNEDLPGALIHKEYSLELNGRILAKKIKIKGKEKERTLLSISSRTFFDESFRKLSYYHRVLPVGATGGADKSSTLAASKVTSNQIQRAGWLSSSGWSQFVLLNPELNCGVAQYLYKLNEQFVWIPFSLDSSFWTPFGWDMAWAATFLDGEDFSAELRYHLFKGDRLTFHKEYRELPEYTAVRKSYKIHPFISKMKEEGQGSDIMSALAPGFPETVGVGARLSRPYSLLRSDEVMVMLYVYPGHQLFGYFPASDDSVLTWTASGPRTTQPAVNVRNAISILKKKYPRFLTGMYWIDYEIHPEAPVHKEHPEWLVRDKNGKPVPACLASYGGDQANFSPEYRRWWIDQCVRFMDYYGFDFIYSDNGGGFAYADWGRGKVVQPTDWMVFLKELHEALSEKGKFLFLNADTGHLFTDLSYVEFLADWEKSVLPWFPNWRDRAEVLMMYKLYQPENSAVILLYWMDYRINKEGGNNNREYTNAVLKLGLRSKTCYYDYNAELKTEPGKGSGGSDVDWGAEYYYEEAYHQATLEMAGTTLVDPGLNPSWLRDYETQIEAYALKQGSAHIFTTTSHLLEKKDITITAESEKAGLIIGKPAFLYRYKRRDDSKFPRRAGPPPEGWEKLFNEIKCETFNPEEGKFKVTFPSVEPEFTEIVSITQIPAVIYSVEGKRTQFLLPETLGCRIDGSLDEKKKTVFLNVIADKPLQIAVWRPKNWGDARVAVKPDGKEVMAISPDKLQTIKLGDEDFLVMDIPPGRSDVEIMGD